MHQYLNRIYDRIWVVITLSGVLSLLIIVVNNILFSDAPIVFLIISILSAFIIAIILTVLPKKSEWQPYHVKGLELLSFWVASQMESHFYLVRRERADLMDTILPKEIKLTWRTGRWLVKGNYAGVQIKLIRTQVLYDGAPISQFGLFVSASFEPEIKHKYLLRGFDDLINALNEPKLKVVNYGITDNQVWILLKDPLKENSQKSRPLSWQSASYPLLLMQEYALKH